jgi:hypothetical protein
LAGEPYKVGTWYHPNIVDYEDSEVKICPSIVESDSYRYNRPQYIDNARRVAARTEAYSDKVPWMNPCTATFTIRMYILMYSVAIVVDSMGGKDGGLSLHFFSWVGPFLRPIVHLCDSLRRCLPILISGGALIKKTDHGEIS